MVFPVTLIKPKLCTLHLVIQKAVTRSWELLFVMQLLLQSWLYATSELLWTPISMQFAEHVNICRSECLAIRNIGKIRKHLAQDDCERLVHVFITSKLDSCNSILYGLPVCQLEKLQRVQNALKFGKFELKISEQGRFEHISPILHKLHWLPVKDRIDFKLW